TWRDQIEEAQNYLEYMNTENITVETPYIDTFLTERTDENKPTKEELCNDILDNNKKYKIAMATVNAKQWNYLKRAEACTTNTEIDTIKEEIRKLVTSIGISR